MFQFSITKKFRCFRRCFLCRKIPVLIRIFFESSKFCYLRRHRERDYFDQKLIEKCFLIYMIHNVCVNFIDFNNHKKSVQQKKNSLKWNKSWNLSHLISFLWVVALVMMMMIWEPSKSWKKITTENRKSKGNE